MKNTILLLSGIILISSSILSANTFPTSSSSLNETAYEENLLIALNSNNTGLTVNAAQKLGEIKSSKAVLPLMKTLKSSENVEERIAAAQSLIKIGDLRGIFAVKQASVYDENERVRKLCRIFYKSNVK